MPAGLRAIQTKDQEVLSPRDLLAISERQKAAEAQAKAKQQEQRLADLEGVDNDLKVPFYRNQVSSLTKQYQEYVTSPDYDPIKASRMKDAILNAKRNLGEIDNNIATKIAENPDSFGIYRDEVFGMFDGSTTLPQSPEAIDFSLNALNYANIDKKNALEYRSKIEPQIDAYLKAKAEKEGRTYTIGNRKFVEKVASLSEDEKNDIATEAANDPQFLKHLQDDIFGREITEEEAEGAAYEELFSLLPTSTRRTEAGTMPKDNRGGLKRYGFGQYTNGIYTFTKGSESPELEVEGEEVDYVPNVGFFEKGFEKITIGIKDKDRAVKRIDFYDEDGDLIEGRLKDIRQYEDGTKQLVVMSRQGDTEILPYAKNKEVIRTDYYLTEGDIEYMIANKEDQERTSRGTSGGSNKDSKKTSIGSLVEEVIKED